MVISSMKDHRVLRYANGDLSVLADLSYLAGGLLNDLVTDDAGRTYVGNFGFDLMGGGAAASADLVLVDLDGTVSVVASDLRFPNGMVITPDGSKLIVGETLGNRYSAFDIGEDGSLSNRTSWAEFGAVAQGDIYEGLQLWRQTDGCGARADWHDTSGPFWRKAWTACAAGTHALTYAARLIAWGMADVVLGGGSEHAGTLTAMAGFGNMTALSTSGTSRPFDAERDGFVMGEGAAAFVLEEWDTAVARGATIIGEVLGGASTADAHHITAPSPGGVGAIRCMRLAIDDAGLTPADVKQINAHGTSTPLNDAAEAAAISEVFGAGTVPVVSTKGVTGHALGAAGALEAAAVLLSFEHGLIPPTANTKVLDDEMDIDVVIGEPRAWTPGPTISNNFGFGGHNGSILLGPAG